MDKITELKQQRAVDVARAREILDAAEVESRDLTAEERSEYERCEAEIASKGERIARQEEQRARELELAARSTASIDPRQTGAAEYASDSEQRQQEYRAAYSRYLRLGLAELQPDERRVLATGEVRADQVKGTQNLGGFLVPTEFEKQLVLHLVQAGTMRQTRARVLSTGDGADLQIPKTTAHGTAGWVAEGGAVTPVTETFGQVTLKSYAAIELVRVSIQLIQDNAVDLEGFLAMAIGDAIGRLENTAFIVGTGSTQPTGISTVTSLGVTAASATAIATDEVMDLFYSVGPQYRRNAEWQMADGTAKALRKLKLSTGEYIWAAGLSVNEPDTLLGKPVHDDPDVPAIATGNKSLLFGDYAAYWIRDVGNFVLRRLDERFADNLLVGFLGWHRTDGNLIDQTGAVKHLVHP